MNFTIQKSTFRKMIKAVLPHVEKHNSIRPSLENVRFEISKYGMKMTSTNGFTLIELFYGMLRSEHPYLHDETRVFLVNGQWLRQWLKTLKGRGNIYINSDSDIHLAFNHVLCEIDRVSPYPDYQPILNEERPYTYTMSHWWLLEAVKDAIKRKSEYITISKEGIICSKDVRVAFNGWVSNGVQPLTYETKRLKSYLDKLNAKHENVTIYHGDGFKGSHATLIDCPTYDEFNTEFAIMTARL